MILALLVAVSVVGCGRHGASAPSAPDPTQPGMTAVAQTDDASSERLLWGLWDVAIEKNTGRVEVVPIRESEFHLNALRFLEPPAFKNLTVQVVSVDPPSGYVEVDVLLTHPFPGMSQYTGFDVRGIILLPGSNMPFADQSLILPGDGEPRLQNPDGWTRWWNPKEFLGVGLFGFQPGLFGQEGGAGVFTSTLNAYRYFADGLGTTGSAIWAPGSGRGSFKAGSTNRRRYQIDFGTNPHNWLRFQYAVDACWVLPKTLNNPKVPDDFPLEANSPEGYAVTVTETENTLWWLDGIGRGGQLSLLINVYNWRLQDEPRVMIDAPEIISHTVEAQRIPGSGGDPVYAAYSTYSADIVPDILSSTGKMDYLITVETDEQYSQGGLTLFFGPLDAKVSGYYPMTTDVSFTPPVIWETVTTAELAGQPSTTECDLTVVGGGPYQGVYFFGQDYHLCRYPLDYAAGPDCVSALEGTFGYTQQDLYGDPEDFGRLDMCVFGKLVCSTTSAEDSPTFIGGLKRDIVFFFNELFSLSGQPPVQALAPNPVKGHFRVVDMTANWATTKEKSKIYWIQVMDPDAPPPIEPDPWITVIAGAWHDPFTGIPWESVDSISAALVPCGDGDGEVDCDSVQRLGVDGDPEGVFGSTDLIFWFLETADPAIECFSIASTEPSGELNVPLHTQHDFWGTPIDIEVLPAHKGGYGVYNWVVALEENEAEGKSDRRRAEYAGRAPGHSRPGRLSVEHRCRSV
jgi:hypothetical protein